MNFLLEESSRMVYHTHLVEIFRAMGNRQHEFVWLLTDLEIYGWQLGRSAQIEADEIVLMTGDALTAAVEEYDPQLVWGVLSGFWPGTAPDPAQLVLVPLAEHNPALWIPDVQIQYPTAQVEIVAFDSSLTLFLSRDDDLSRRFQAHFPEAVDLNEHNRHVETRRQQGA